MRGKKGFLGFNDTYSNLKHFISLDASTFDLIVV